MCWSKCAALPVDGTAPARARRFVRAAINSLSRSTPAATRSTADEQTIDDLLLITSELVTNGVTARGTELAITLEAHFGEITVAVFDDGPGQPRPTSAGPRDPSGRGLAIVDSIAERGGVTPDGVGKSVWATIALSRGSTITVDCGRQN